MALFHTTVVDNQIKALDTIGSVSGSICTFDTDRAERLVNLEVAIVATQSGSGTPSPSNPRSINGFSACNLSVNGTTETIPFGQTIYGGSLNVVSGVLTVTHKKITFTGDSSENWYYTSSLNRVYIYVSDAVADITTPIISNIIGFNSSYTPSDYTGHINPQGNFEIFAPATITNANDWKTWLSSNNIELVYKLTTPTTIQLDSKQIQTIANSVNNIYADTGDIIDLKFVLTVGKAIS